MHIRTACLLALVVGGCAARLHLDDNASQLEELRAQNKGIILFETSLHCGELDAKVGRPDADGHYVAGESITLVSIYYLHGEPSQVVLPAGNYNLVQLSCDQGRGTQTYLAREFKHGSLLSGHPTVYDQPIVKFTVGPGEIVDVGRLYLPTLNGGFFGFGQSTFQPSVGPITESKLQAFANHKPTLYAHLIHRAMTTPGQAVPRQAQRPTASASSPR